MSEEADSYTFYYNGEIERLRAELAAARERAERAEAVLRWIADMGSVDGFVGASHAIEAVRMANEVLKGGEE